MTKYPFYRVSLDRTENGHRGKATAEAATVRLAAPSEKATQKKKESQRGVIIGAGFFFLLIVSFMAAVTAEYSTSFISRIPSKATPNTGGSEPYSGRIVLETIERKRCRRTTFDNRTGRVTEINEVNQPCAELAKFAVDDNGLPKPVGTISRLDAIGKSFLNR
jgi:hypothetical protein